MTRAREKLTLTNARQRMLYGRTTANRPSRFLDEIPEENMRWESKPRIGGMEHDPTFGGDRWDGGPSYGGFGGGPAQRSARPSTGIYTSGGVRENGTVHSYRETRPAPQRPLASASRSAADAAPMLQLSQGDMVEHTAFGKGMVLSVRPMGGDALVEVAFDKVGAKKLMLKSAGKHMTKV